jgi:peptidyl-prolyl cis-trans isomerase D
MLKLMRDSFSQLKWILVAIVAVFILFIFVDWGAGGAGGKADDRSYVARVNGETISSREYERAMFYTQKQYEQMYRQALTPEAIQALGLPKQVLDSLVDQHLLLQEAQRLHLNATADEVRKKILEIPTLNPDGKFVGDELYARYVTGAMGFSSPAEFEDELGREITIQKIESALQNSVIVAPKAAEAEYRRTAENAKIRYVLYPANRETALVSVTPQEVEQFYKANTSKYMHGEQRAIKYLIADYARLRAQIVPTDAELQKRYDTTKEQFKHAAQAHILHILIKVDPGATPQQDAEAKAKAESIVKQLRGGADFAALARANSGDPGSAAKGGDMGFVDQGSTVEPFNTAAFSAPLNTISDPLRSKEFGYHIIKVLERRPAGYSSFQDVKPSLAQQFADERSRDLARDEIARVLQRVKAQKPKSAQEFTALANDKVSANDTQWFGKSEAIPGLGNNAPLSGWAFAAKVGDAGDAIVATQRGPAIPYLYATRPAGVSALDEIRGRVEADARQEKARQAAKLALAKALPAPNVDEVAKKVGLSAADTTVTRLGYISGFNGDTGPLVDAAFKTPVGQVAGPIVVDAGAVVLQVTEQKKVDAKDLAEHGTAYADVMRQQEARTLRQALLLRLRKGAKIDVNQKYLNQRNQGGGDQQQAG